jgi:hypothetical protein
MALPRWHEPQFAADEGVARVGFRSKRHYRGRVTERRALPRSIRIVGLIWIAGFLVGTTTHIADLVLGGSDVYAGYPDAVRLFWVSLTVLDPLAVVLIAVRSRAGVVLGVLIMLADVAVNVSVAATVGGLGLYGLVNQALFCAFVLLAARPLWRAFSTRTEPARG